MERAIGLERTYSLGDYKSLKVSDFINDIPEELAVNEEFMNDLRSLQILGAERLYYAYAELSDNLSGLDGSQARLDYLDSLENETYTRIVNIIISENGKEESE